MNQCKSVFNYTVDLGPDGTIIVKDDCGCEIKGTTEMPPIKKIINTRSVCITEAEGSQWVYMDPPGFWYKIPST